MWSSTRLTGRRSRVGPRSDVHGRPPGPAPSRRRSFSPTQVSVCRRWKRWQANRTKVRTKAKRGRSGSIFLGLDGPAGLHHLDAVRPAQFGGGGDRRSVTRTSTSSRWATRTGAERANLLESATSTMRRACSMMARCLHLADVEVEQRAVGVDGRGADHGDVDAELRDQRLRLRPHDAAVAVAHAAARDHDLDRAPAVELGRDLKVVGDDEQARVAGPARAPPPRWWCRWSGTRRNGRARAAPPPRRSAACAARR